MLVPGMALRHITGAPEQHLQRLQGSGSERFEPQETDGKAGLPGIACSKSAGSKRSGVQTPGPETGQPAGTPLPPRLQRMGKKAFLSNARQEEINETNTISKATPESPIGFLPKVK